MAEKMVLRRQPALATARQADCGLRLKIFFHQPPEAPERWRAATPRLLAAAVQAIRFFACRGRQNAQDGSWRRVFPETTSRVIGHVLIL